MSDCTAVDVCAGYQPGRAVAEFVVVRDGHASRLPGSGARTLELDHVREFNHVEPADGGPTTPANLAALGKRDHQAKTDRLVTVTGDANTVLSYRTRAGHTYPSRPHQYADPRPPPY